MLPGIGIIMIFICVFGIYIESGGKIEIILHALPHELGTILGAAIGAITFTGSIIAWGKLQGKISGKPVVFKGQHALNAALGALLVFLIFMLCTTESAFFFWMIALVALALGILMIIPIGGADMPVIVSMLNSYSGWAAAGIGFTLQNDLLIITGALVGSSGAILSYIMCKGMNRSFLSVVLGGFGGEAGGAASTHNGDNSKIGNRRRMMIPFPTASVRG